MCIRDRGRTIDFTDDSFDHITSWNWEFRGGTPATSILPNPTIRYDSLGKFDVNLTVSDGSNTKSIVKKSYISVDRCAGNEEFSAQPWFRVFPNPASEKVTIEVSPQIKGKFTVILFDLAGRKMTGQQSYSDAGGGTITLNLNGFKKGLYFLRAQSGKIVSTVKLIIY